MDNGQFENLTKPSGLEERNEHEKRLIKFGI